MKIPRYREVLAHIDKNQKRHIAYVIELVNQPSISAQNLGITECAEKVRQMMKRVGLKARVIETDGNPIVFGEHKTPKAKHTVLFYNHYDVQPPDPLEQWVSDPFKPEVRDGLLFGRGTADNKGTFTSRISAFESIVDALGECPVNVKFLVEGEEETGSPTLAAFATNHRDLLKSDAIIWEGSERHSSGRPTITLGNKGILDVELRTRGPKTSQHSSKAPILPNPAWRLVFALSTMKSVYGQITIDDYFERVRKPNRLSEALLEKVPFDLREEKKMAGLTHIEGEKNPRNVKRRLFFEPTATINGLTSGYSGRGMMSIVPATASAKMDFRLVPDQDPDDILRKIKRHLKKRGFGDVEVEGVSKMYPSRTEPNTSIAQITMKVAKQVYHVDPIVYPNHIASGAMYVAVNILERPVVAVGAAYYGSRMHSPNEHIRLNDYLLATKLIAAILLGYAQAP